MSDVTAQYQAYDEYKPSGVEWLGDLPEHWKVVPLRNIFGFRNEKNDPIKTDNILSLSIASGVTEYSEEGRGGNKRKDDLSAYKLAYPNDIVLNSMNVIVGAVGLSRYFGAISPVYYALFNRNEEADLSFFEKIFLHSGFQYSLLQYGKGIMMKLSGTGKLNTIRMKVSPDDLKNVSFPFPPIAEQKAIAKFLDEKTAQIDEAIGVKERQIELLKERKKILIQNAVTRGLNPDAPMKDSGVDWIEEIPTHWSVVPILAVSDVIDPNPSHRNPEYVDEGFPFISTQEFRVNGRIETNTPRRVSEKTVLEQEARCHFQPGSLVYSRKGTIGAVRVLPNGIRLAILDSLCVINPKKNIISRYLLWSLSADYISAQYGPIVNGAALPQLSVGKVRSFKVILPPKEEVEPIVEYIDKEGEKIENAISTVNEQIEKLKEYKATLINSAVTGKIKVA